MTEFTSGFIAEQRKSLIERENFYAWDNCISLDALDHIERQTQRIAELEQERRWIPVSERLPEKNGFYYLHIHSDDGRSYERVGIFFIDGGFDVLCDKVTHWQPLPQPPKEGE